MRSKFLLIIPAAALSIAVFAFAAGLAKETLGGVRPVDDVSVVIQKYGKPESKTGGAEEPATGCKVWTYSYPSLGLEFVTCSEPNDGREFVRSIHAYGKATVKTSKGIGIGATRAQTKKLYPRIKQYEEGFEGLNDVDSWRSILFKFEKDKVVEIIYSQMPE